MSDLPLAVRFVCPSDIPDKWKQVVVAAYEKGRSDGKRSVQSDILQVIGAIGLADDLREEFSSTME
jgi:hypothetical protein